MKSLNGAELAGFIKERQAHQVKSLPATPKLLILRDSDNPVITKYVNLKKQYGKDIGVEVIDVCTNVSLRSSGAWQGEDERAAPVTTGQRDEEQPNLFGCPSEAVPSSQTGGGDALREEIVRANNNPSINGIIIQLPLLDKSLTDKLCNLIAPSKDVDGLGEHASFESATATAINWLLAGYDIKLQGKKIALVGRGKLVGAPLYKMFTNSGYDVELFHRGSDLTKLRQFDIIISATGKPGLISDSMVKPGAILIDAGTASENGVLKGDLAPEIRKRTDLAAITPITGGVGPLTITCLFDHVIQSYLHQNPATRIPKSSH